MNKPTFSIYIPVKNRPELLKETLTAIAEQTFPDFECMICDDGSSDNTLEIIQHFSKQDKRFKYITNSISLGDPLSSNRLLEELKGLYAARMDSDDLPKKTWLENSLIFAKDFFTSGGVAFGCQAEIFGDNIDIHFDKLKEVDPVRWSCWSLFNYELNHSGLVFDRQVQIDKNLTYKNYVMNNDWDFISRLSHFGKVSNLPSVEVGIRRHADNVSASYKVTEDKDSLSVILRNDLIVNKLGFFPTSRELALHCTAHHAPYWKFEEQKFVWDNKEIYLSMLLSWLDKLVLANKKTNYFDEAILKQVLYNEIYVKAKSNFDNISYPEKFKMLWTGD